MKKKKVKDITKELNDKISSMDELIDAWETRVCRCEKELHLIGVRFDTDEKRLDKCEGNAFDDADLVDSMCGRLDEHDKRIEGIEDRDGKRDDQLEDHENRIITTESVINDIMSRLDGIEEKLSSMSARLDAIESKEEKVE